MLAVAGAGDFQDPVWACRKLFEQLGGDSKQFLRLGREEGFEAFGHVDMLVSKAAQAQVWPLVARWLRDPRVPVHESTVAAEPAQPAIN